MCLCILTLLSHVIDVLYQEQVAEADRLHSVSH